MLGYALDLLVYFQKIISGICGTVEKWGILPFKFIQLQLLTLATQRQNANSCGTANYLLVATKQKNDACLLIRFIHSASKLFTAVHNKSKMRIVAALYCTVLKKIHFSDLHCTTIRRLVHSPCSVYCIVRIWRQRYFRIIQTTKKRPVLIKRSLVKVRIILKVS